MKTQLKPATILRLGTLLLGLASGTARAQTDGTLHHFTGTDGANPTSLVLSGGTLFGTTSSGGSSNLGTVFRLSPDGTDFRVLKNFTGRDGAYPHGLVLSGATLYGRTPEGGISNRGTVFRLSTDGGDFALLKEFTGGEEADVPRALALSGTTLYGTSYNGGCSNRGAICRLNTDGSGFAIIKDFTDPVQGGEGYTEGCLPGILLAASGTTLYGTTVGGGIVAAGGIFRINTDGTGYTALKQGTFEDGGHFTSGVILADNTLYGTTPWGGGGIGALFRLNSDGSGFSILRSCHPSEVYQASSLAVSGSWFCGVSQPTAIFVLRTNGSHFGFLKRFPYTEGSVGGLVLAGTALYGTTTSGGHSNRGTVFALSLLPPTVVRAPQSRTAEPGDNIHFLTEAEGTAPLTYQWVLDDTNVLSGCTNAFLKLTNVQSVQAGAYTVIVSNLFGGVTSAPAVLNVITPVARTRVPGLDVRGEVGRMLNVECVDALGLTMDWLQLESVSLTSTSQFCFDLTTPRPPQRFYRVWQPAPANLTPKIELQMVPALTLTGSPGELIRVDGINAVGPTDAWFTLATLTLTNTSQHYFDVTALGQPTRLYRLVPVP